MKVTLTENAEAVLRRRYYHPGEDWPMLCRRVAHNVSQADHFYNQDAEWAEERFYQEMLNLRFLPASPTLMNAGGSLQQMSACFVLPVHDDTQAIFKTGMDAAIIHKSGGGTGFDFSELRPEGSKVRTTGGVASGPVSFMGVYNAATGAMKQGGTRRGANMGILRCDHPDIEKFIRVKLDSREMTNFNLSVGITDDFMSAVKNDSQWELRHPATQQSQWVRARELWNLICQCAWSTGDPGLVFLDRINGEHPNPAIGTLQATNPCGEAPLLPYESCNLGSINLAKFVNDRQEVDLDGLYDTIYIGVHFLDNVIDMNRYPLPEIERATKLTRRIGLGVMGWADMLIALGLKYDSTEALACATKIAGFFASIAESASANLAIVRGKYPAHEESEYQREMRNTQPTTIAPTGTISMIAGCSSGIEPIYDKQFTKTVMDGTVLSYKAEVPDHLLRTAHDVSPADHVRMQSAWQAHIHNGVSKTVNLRNEATVFDVSDTYWLAYDLDCKGITIFRDGCRDAQVLKSGVDAHPAPIQEDCADGV